ncbi:MAG: VWA domain-containing protein, partial [Treponema sp.]|nr:VWA domain-containing protein [Treponema sp.]
MKKVVCVFIFIASVFSTVSGQEGPIDLILLLDTSSSMSASYQEINDYMTGPFLREFLRTGDTFHLISFSDTPRTDVSRRIEGRGDVETIIGRMLLQYPLNPWSDIAAALSYTEQYVSTLPSRPKKIVLLTDGVSDPRPGTSSGTLDAAGLQNLITETKNRLSRRDITLEYVKISPGTPLANLPGSGRAPMSRTPEPAAPGTVAPGAVSQGLPAGTGPRSPSGLVPPAGTGPQVPAQPGVVPPRDAAPVPAQTPPATEPPRGPQGVQPEQRPGTSPSEGGQTGTPDTAVPFPDISPGAPEPGGEGLLDSPPRTEALPGEETVERVSPPPSAPLPARPAAPVRYNEGRLSLPFIIVFVILGLAALGLIIFLVTRRLQGSPNRAMAQAASRPAPAAEEGQFTDHSAALASYAAAQRPRTGPYSHQYKPQNINSDYEGPLMLNLFVEDQNTFIGKRNIHALKSGYTFTVGGGKSDFLIFLVPIPPHIGELRCDGSRCTFIPRKPQYFPDLGSQQVPDCIGKTIRVISDKKYELHFRMERYEDPLKALNRLLHSV